MLRGASGVTPIFSQKNLERLLDFIDEYEIHLRG